MGLGVGGRQSWLARGATEVAKTPSWWRRGRVVGLGISRGAMEMVWSVAGREGTKNLGLYLIFVICQPIVYDFDPPSRKYQPHWCPLSTFSRAHLSSPPSLAPEDAPWVSWAASDGFWSGWKTILACARRWRWQNGEKGVVSWDLGPPRASCERWKGVGGAWESWMGLLDGMG